MITVNILEIVTSDAEMNVLSSRQKMFRTAEKADEYIYDLVSFYRDDGYYGGSWSLCDPHVEWIGNKDSSKWIIITRH